VPLRGTCPPSPERHALGFTITPLAGDAPGVAQIVDAEVSSLALRSLQSTLRRNRTCGRDPDRRSRPRKGDRRCVCRTEAARRAEHPTERRRAQEVPVAMTDNSEQTLTLSGLSALKGGGVLADR
jgi:hypothetical protein